MLTTSNTIAFSFDHVSKRYHFREGTTLKECFTAFFLRRRDDSFLALRDVSLRIERGSTLGIIGRNGSGKSTLLKLLAGVTVPSEGRVEVNGRISPLIELGAGFHPDLTGRENVFLNGAILGMKRATVLQHWKDIVDFAELWDFIDMPVKHYSSGMYLRLAFSLAVHSEPDILVVDESLGVGDVAFQEKCLERIREFQHAGVTIVMVSHGLVTIRDFCDRVIQLDKGQVVQDGDPHEVVAKYTVSLLGTAELPADSLTGEGPPGAGPAHETNPAPADGADQAGLTQPEAAMESTGVNGSPAEQATPAVSARQTDIKPDGSVGPSPP